MRIAYVSTDPGVPVFGMKGGSIHVQEMLRAFLSTGADVAVISPRLNDEPPRDLASVQRIPLPALPKQDPEDRGHHLLGMNAQVEDALAQAGPWDLVYERHALFAHGAMEFGARRGIPAVLEVNAPLLDEQARHRVLALPDIAAASTRRAMAAATLVSAVSSEVSRYCLLHGAGERGVHVLPNAVNPERFPLRASPAGPFTIGFLGTLKPWHDVRTLIGAIALLRSDTLPDARLVIIGDGPERARLEAEAGSLGIEGAVEFTGLVHPERVPGELARLHAAVAPYPGSGPFYFSPLKLYEYMAAGLPAVASRVGDLPDMVSEGRTGLLYAPDDTADLARVLGELANAPQLRARLGAAARDHVLRHHTWGQLAARVLELTGLDALPQPAIAS
jgi:glycosyltransferase involved in cell wall biosynthesis